MNIESAGARLKKIRQERGLSLEDIQKKTKIHFNVLRAIEGDSISDLSPVYLKSFIKIYCNYLGLDPKEFTGESSQQQKPVLNATIGRDIGERVEKRPSSSFIKDASLKLGAMRPAAGLKKIIVFTVLAVVFIFLVFNLVRFISSRFKRQPAKSQVFIPAATAQKITAKAAKARPSRAAKKEITQGFMLGLFARHKSWVSVKVDGKVVFHGVLAAGRSESWSAKEKIELSLGDAGAVELQVNDQRFANLGRRGQPLKNIIINKEGLKISR